MSYNKRPWANGDLITKERMNNIENGIYNAHDNINVINNKVEENTNNTNTVRQDISDIKLQIGTEELTTTSKKIKGAINDLSSQIKEKANISTTDNLQSQINNLVLHSGGDSNLEVIQSRVNENGYIFSTLKEKDDFSMDRLSYEQLSRKMHDAIYAGTVNGAVFEDNKLTIPSGQLGGSSYLGYILTITTDMAGKDYLIELTYDYTDNLLGKFDLRYSLSEGVTITGINYNNLGKLFAKISVDSNFNVNNTIRLFAFCTNYSQTFSTDEVLTLTGYSIKRYFILEEFEEDIKKYSDEKLFTEIKNNNDDLFLTDLRTLNLFDKSKAELTGYYDKTGTFITNSYLNSTDLMNVEGYSVLSINRYTSSQPLWTFYDKNKNFVYALGNQGYSCVIPSDKVQVSYARVAILATEVDTCMIVPHKNPCMNKYYEYNSPDKYIKTHLYGKHLATIGDSLTQMEFWQPILESVLGISYEKYAQSGGNMVAIANFIDNVTTTPDILTVWAGTNDWYNGVELGDFLSTDGNTYSGALNKLIKKVGTDFGKTKLLIITPMQRADAPPTSNKNTVGQYLNANNNTLEDFADMCIKYCDFYGIECLDMYHRSGVNSMNISNYSDDLLHPNRAGFNDLVWKIIEKLKSL